MCWDITSQQCSLIWMRIIMVVVVTLLTLRVLFFSLSTAMCATYLHWKNSTKNYQKLPEIKFRVVSLKVDPWVWSGASLKGYIGVSERKKLMSLSTAMCATYLHWKNSFNQQKKSPPLLPQTRQSPVLDCYYRVQNEFACGVLSLEGE